MSDSNLIYDFTNNGGRMVWFNGIHVTDQCTFEGDKIIWPEWIAKEIEAGQIEYERSRKPFNRVLRFFGLYKARASNTFVQIRAK